MKVFVELPTTERPTQCSHKNTFSIEFSNYFSFPMAGGLNLLFCIYFLSSSTMSPFLSVRRANNNCRTRLHCLTSGHPTESIHSDQIQIALNIYCVQKVKRTKENCLEPLRFVKSNLICSTNWQLSHMWR